MAIAILNPQDSIKDYYSLGILIFSSMERHWDPNSNLDHSPHKKWSTRRFSNWSFDLNWSFVASIWYFLFFDGGKRILMHRLDFNFTNNCRCAYYVESSPLFGSQEFRRERKRKWSRKEAVFFLPLNWVFLNSI